MSLKLNRDRREFIRAAVGTSLLPALGAFTRTQNAFAQASGDGDEPHFFIMMNIARGLDFSHLWDARPLELTEKKIRVNLMKGEAPVLYTAPNGGSTLVHSTFDPLRAYVDRFSIVKGMHMSPDFDGHDQNMNLLFTGNPFGGPFFLPHLNQRNLPLDGLANGSLNATVSNDAKLPLMSLATLRQMVERAGRTRALTADNPLFRMLHARYSALLGVGTGSISLGSGFLLNGLESQQKIHADLKVVDVPPIADPENPDELTPYIQSAFQLFKMGTAKSLFLSMSNMAGGSPDTHDFANASKTGAMLKECVRRIILVLDLLKKTPYDSTRSFADVTTFLVSTEFGRTNRQTSAVFEQSGTDHNPYNSSCLLAGKGIAGGKIIGASDVESADETLSGAHLFYDTQKKFNMGRPFDFQSSQPRKDLPQKYALGDYVNSASLINTLYTVFGVPESFHRKVDRNASAPAPAIKSLIA